MKHRQNIRISVIGAENCDAQTALTARRLGRLLAEAGNDIVCGGLDGVIRVESPEDALKILGGLDLQAARTHY